jgi:HEAT repeat protein
VNTVRKYLNYVIFGAIVLLVVGLAVNHSRHVSALVEELVNGTPEQHRQAATELIQAEQFSDSITGEPVDVRVKVAAALADLGTVDGIKQASALLKDPEKSVRQAAVKTLKQIGATSPDTIKELMNGLKDGDVNVRKGTIAVLTDTDGIGPKQNPDVVAAIIDIMKREGGARAAGGDVLSAPTFDPVANPRSVPALLALLDNKDDGVKQGGADALGKIGDPSAVDRLILVMHNPATTADVRRVVVGAIALIAVPAGEAALTEAVDNPNDDNEARAQAAAGLGKIATPTAIDTLIKALGDDDLNLRSASVAALARAAKTDTGGAKAAAVLAKLTAALQGPNQVTRLGATQALQTVQSPTANAALIATLNDTTNGEAVRAAAAAALGYDGNQAAVAPLVAALSQPSGTVQVAATNALGAIGTQATAVLLAVTQHGGATAYYAAQALGQQGEKALPALESAAKIGNPLEQRWVAVALGETNQPDARGTLQQLAASTDPDVAYVAHEQLNHLGRNE